MEVRKDCLEVLLRGCEGQSDHSPLLWEVDIGHREVDLALDQLGALVFEPANGPAGPRSSTVTETSSGSRAAIDDPTIPPPITTIFLAMPTTYGKPPVGPEREIRLHTGQFACFPGPLAPGLR